MMCWGFSSRTKTAVKNAMKIAARMTAVRKRKERVKKNRKKTARGKTSSLGLTRRGRKRFD